MYFVKSASGATSRPAEAIVILNSATVFMNGAVKLAAGGVDGADAVTDRIYGICVGFVVGDGNTPIDNALSSQYDGTYTADTSYAAAADNQTDKMVKALVIPIRPGDVIRAELDATKGTTTGSDTVGYYASVLTTDESKLDESTATSSAEQFLIVDPSPSEGGNWVDVKVIEHQLAQ